MPWNNITLDDMEETARQEADGCCNKKIRGEWLEVQFEQNVGFRYKWGKNYVSSEVAKRVLESN